MLNVQYPLLIFEKEHVAFVGLTLVSEDVQAFRLSFRHFAVCRSPSSCDIGSSRQTNTLLLAHLQRV